VPGLYLVSFIIHRKLHRWSELSSLEIMLDLGLIHHKHHHLLLLLLLLLLKEPCPQVLVTEWLQAEPFLQGRGNRKWFRTTMQAGRS